jgi:large subunit ribosomal protein L31
MAAREKVKKPKVEVVIGEYRKLTASCACGATFEIGSTLPEVHVDICSSCHPYFTGENKVVDAEGRIEKFKKKYNLS